MHGATNSRAFDPAKRKEKERKGKERKGKERKGKERKGKTRVRPSASIYREARYYTGLPRDPVKSFT